MSERRVAIRYDSEQAAPCHFARSDRVQCRWGKVHDISNSGIALEMDVSIESGTRLIIELPAPSYQAIRPVAATVIHTQPQLTGGWLIGCAFEQELRDDERALMQ